MLPDGAHDRPEDWTIFYLGQVPALVTDPSLLARARADVKGKGRADQPAPQVTPDDNDGDKGLLYVMSLVRTKKDVNVRRSVVRTFRATESGTGRLSGNGSLSGERLSSRSRSRLGIPTFRFTRCARVTVTSTLPGSGPLLTAH